MEIINSSGVYHGFAVENIKFSKFSDDIKKLTFDDTNPLYKGFKLVMMFLFIIYFFLLSW